jgi:hypothetical protein
MRCALERGDWEMIDKQSPPDSGREATPKTRLISLANALLGGMKSA